MEKRTIKEVLDAVSAITMQNSEEEGYIQVSYGMTRENGEALDRVVVVTSELRGNHQKEGWVWEIRTCVKTPYALSNLSASEALEVAKCMMKAARLAVRLQEVTQGHYWSREEVQEFWAPTGEKEKNAR